MIAAMGRTMDDVAKGAVLGLVAALTLAGCGGDDDGSTPIDGPVIDTPGPMVMAVPCNTVDPLITVTPLADAFDPPTATTAIGTAVRFTMDAFHNSISNDGLWTANFNETICVKFDTAGTYVHHCGVHNFTGQIVVQ